MSETMIWEVARARLTAGGYQVRYTRGDTRMHIERGSTKHSLSVKSGKVSARDVTTLLKGSSGHWR